MGSWQELARIDSLRVTVEDDEANACWEQFFLGVPAFQKLAEDSNESSRKSNVTLRMAKQSQSYLKITGDKGSEKGNVSLLFGQMAAEWPQNNTQREQP